MLFRMNFSGPLFNRRKPFVHSTKLFKMHFGNVKCILHWCSLAISEWHTCTWHELYYVHAILYRCPCYFSVNQYIIDTASIEFLLCLCVCAPLHLQHHIIVCSTTSHGVMHTHRVTHTQSEHTDYTHTPSEHTHYTHTLGQVDIFIEYTANQVE